MGMDVYGTNPTSPEGEYFRANVWSWHPLATYLQEAELIDNDSRWHTNEGHGLDAAGACQLGEALDRLIANGSVERYAKEYQEFLDTVPDEPCEFCEATGTTTQAVADKYPAYQRYVGQTCIQCKGTGIRAFC
jgi:hypothetical protein